ncbi:unnamed protein product [Cuscuta epithymum]|uniref:Uncharacterized protein n=1 Tax=Cuscuta epithymum TaxID=186058 RepID=A0AAV0FB18_9ASTE|nr:unnamed protein product [Cuscuta epithymum]CAH9132710.1 unnamed protein product [Cuscuta epithymum]
MGGVLSKAADGFGNALAVPFKAMLEGSCEEVCSGVWDVSCFITHLCVSDLIKLFMILVLCYITLLFLYMFFKLGICQCVGKTICGMYCSACKVYWTSIGCLMCFFWHKLINVQRVDRRLHRRRRFVDVESGDNSLSLYGESSFVDGGDVRMSRKRKMMIKGTGERRLYSQHYSRHHSPRHQHCHQKSHHPRGSMYRREAGLQVKGKPLRLEKLRHHSQRKDIVVVGPKMASFKRRRIVVQ